MKELLKKILPPQVKQRIIKLLGIRSPRKLYNYDRNRLSRAAFNMSKDPSANNLRALMTFHYHALEKGLSNANLRLGFGKRAVEQLFRALDQYIESGYPLDDIRFQTSLSVLAAYTDLHRKHEYDLGSIGKTINAYEKYLSPANAEVGGYTELLKSGLPDFVNLPFDQLAKHRHSVRDFGSEPIEERKVLEAIQTATNSPSVCNRQAWHVYYVKAEDKVQEILHIQGGLTGNGQNLQAVLLVTADKQYMSGANERNQTYVDGGLFAMSLLYGLTAQGVASCTLNTDFDIQRDRRMKQLLGVHDSEDLILCIALGSYPDKFKIAKSQKDDSARITTIIV